MASPPIDLARIRQLLAELDQLFCDHPELGDTDPARYHHWLATPPSGGTDRWRDRKSTPTRRNPTA